MIERLSVHDDARLKQIVLTDYGRRIHGAAVHHAHMLEEKLYRNFTEEEMDTLLLLLKNWSIIWKKQKRKLYVKNPICFRTKRRFWNG